MAATAPDAHARRPGNLDTDSPDYTSASVDHFCRFAFLGAMMAVVAVASLATAHAAVAAEGHPTLAAPFDDGEPVDAPKIVTPKDVTSRRTVTRHTTATQQSARSARRPEATATTPIRHPGTAQRAHKMMLRWAPYRTEHGSATKAKSVKYGRTSDHARVALQPSFDDGSTQQPTEQPAIPSLDQPNDTLPDQFQLPAPGDTTQPGLPDLDQSPLPGGDTTPFPGPGLDGMQEPSSQLPGQLPGVEPTPFGDELAQGSRFELGPCPTIEDLDPISALDDRIEPDRSGAMPPQCALGDREFKGRNWSLTTYTWKASALCHKPLYFEDMALERYGHSLHPLAQPWVSAAHFFVSIPTLPYQMGMDPPWECQYDLGYYRPGKCAPRLLYPLPLSLRGALSEAGVATGLVFILP